MIGTWRDHRIFGLTYGEATWLAIGVVALAYELWAVATRDGDVLTRAMRANLPRWSSIVVGLGVLFGHLTGNTWPAPRGIWAAPFAVLALALARDAFIGGRIPVAAVMPLFFLGYGLGCLWVGRP